MNIDINKAPNETCTSCGCPFWKQRMLIKKISGLLVGESKDKIMNIEYMACEYCGKPHAATMVEVPKWKPGMKAPEITATSTPGEG